jgi:hypothetical protein
MSRKDEIQQRLIEIEHELCGLSARRKVLGTEKEQLIREKKSVKDPLFGGKITVSDHALIRWLERMKGIDMDLVRQKVLSDQQVLAIRCGASAIRSNGHRYVIKDYTLVSIVPEKAS